MEDRKGKNKSIWFESLRTTTKKKKREGKKKSRKAQTKSKYLKEQEA